MSKSAVPISLIILALGFSALIYQVPFIAPFSLAIAGIVSLYTLLGNRGISYIFSKPKKLVSTFFIGLIAAFVFAFSGLIFATRVLNSNTHDNPLATKMNWVELLKPIPMLLGEELITIVLLLIIVNILGGHEKHLLL